MKEKNVFGSRIELKCKHGLTRSAGNYHHFGEVADNACPTHCNSL